MQFLFGQENFATQYNSETIYLQQGFFGPQYVKGDEKLPTRKIGVELNQYPESYDLYEKYFLMKVIGLGSLVAGPLLINASIAKNESVDSFLTAYLGTVFIGVFASIESLNKLNKAIWVYNRESLKRNHSTP